MNEEITNELIIIEKISEVQIVTDINTIILEIKNKISPLVVDVTTDKGRKEVRSNAFRITKTKTALITMIDNQIDLKEKEIQPTLNIIAKLKENKRLVKSELETLSNEVKKPAVIWEDNERQRIDKIKSIIDSIKSYQTYLSDYLGMNKAFIELSNISTKLDEFTSEAILEKEKSIAVLKSNMVRIEQQERDARELEALRKEKLERERLEKEELLRKEGEERARQKLIAEKALAESLKLLAEAHLQPKAASLKETMIEVTTSELYKLGINEGRIIDAIIQALIDNQFTYLKLVDSNERTNS